MSNRVRDFDLSDVLTVTTGRLISSRHMDGVYDILNFMTGDDLFTHQLPRALTECQPRLLEQHPQLADIEIWPEGDEITQEGVAAWLVKQKAIYGATLPVQAIPGDDHIVIDPLTELEQMVGADKIIAVKIP